MNKILTHGLIAATASLMAIAPANANPVGAIMSGTRSAGCQITQRQAETIYLQLQLLEVDILPILYLGTVNTPEGFRAVLDRLTAISDVVVVECAVENIFEGFSLLYVAPNAKKLANIQADENAGTIWMNLVPKR